ncbi:MAG: hypothetical protein ACJ76R_09260 [Solirubrobacteraceae bacterium]
MVVVSRFRPGCEVEPEDNLADSGRARVVGPAHELEALPSTALLGVTDGEIVSVAPGDPRPDVRFAVAAGGAG